MAGISKCEGTGCPLKETCYRFVAKSNEYMQPFFGSIPYDKQNKKCAEFRAVPFCKLTKSNKHE